MRLNVRCRGYKQKPTVVYREGEYVGRLPLYGLGKCPACERVIGLAPKSGTIVLHKILPQHNDLTP